MTIEGFYNASDAAESALEDAIAACNAERIIDPDNVDDETYNRAIDHCITAILRLIADGDA